jgi:hypothetical protein
VKLETRGSASCLYYASKPQGIILAVFLFVPSLIIPELRSLSKGGKKLHLKMFIASALVDFHKQNMVK